MALKATIFKVELSIADLDRNYYADHSFTIARHPSETDERMMVRVLAYALHADAALRFGKGLCVDDEPDLWQRDLTGAIELWIDVGQPDEKWIRKACGRAQKVVVVSYGRASDIWWNGIRDKLARLSNLTVWNLPPDVAPALAGLTARSMHLKCTLQDGQVCITDGREITMAEPQRRMGA